nr:MAG TPA: 50S ribosomal protein L19 [Caudoviricetes sp.]
MIEYIEREAALEICETEYQNRLRMFDYCGDTVAWNIGGEIKALPTADVAPVVHGEWLLKHIGVGHYWDCSVCHTNPCIYVTQDTKFCPNCGARMDGDEQC